MHRIPLFPLALLVLSQGVAAQQPPSAGGQLQQIPSSPAPQRAAPRIGIVPGSSVPEPQAADTVRIKVDSLRITGARAYPENELIALSGFKPGSEWTLTELRAMASKITDRYRSDGYVLAQAYLPAQDVNDGVVTIAVLEGRYGRIVLRNQTRLADDVARAQLAGIDSGDTIRVAPLESRLLLLSDIPGIAVSSTLTPGQSPGASDLVIDVMPGQRVTGSVDADNAGNRYTGTYRIGGTVNLNNPAGRGDLASLRVLTSGSGLNYARASYQMLFGKASAGVAYSALRYKLGDEFESLGASGTAQVASVYASYPLVRSRAANLYALLDADAATFRDRLDSTSSTVDKKTQAVRATLRGDRLDGTGSTSYWMTGSVGNVDNETASVRAQDAVTARSNGHFSKLGFNVARLQSLTETVSLYGAFSGQLASKNLDVSEKMELGGVNAVRAYPEGEAYADEGLLLTLEARLQLPRLGDRLPGQMQLIGFVDVGSVATDHNPWAPGQNRRTLSGAGVALNWAAYNDFVLRLTYARRLKDEAARSAPDSSGRFWVQAVKYF